jgi:hypothetical protein
MFDRHKFSSPQAELASSIFTFDQLGFLKNTLIGIAEEKLKLPYDPGAPEAFKFQHEYLRGQFELLNYLIDCHENATQEIGGQKDEFF